MARPAIPESGQTIEVFRVIPRDGRIDVFRSFADVARFHDRSDNPTSYLSMTPRTAVLEVSQGVRDVRPEQYRLLRCAVRLIDTVNLCNPDERRRIGLTGRELFGPKRPGDPRHEARLLVARAARNAGAQGLWYPSRIDRTEGVNLVLFLENASRGRLAAGAVVEVIDQDDDPAAFRLPAVLDDIKSALGSDWLRVLRERLIGDE
ncbi:MAG: RES family NAD+ phosphorylase [Candidatus Rokuibacteriota bacterium]